MKFDRDTLLGIVICAAILFGWEPLARHLGWLPPKTAPAATAPAAPATPQPAPAEQAPTPAAAVQSQETPPSPAAPVAVPAAKVLEHAPLAIGNADMTLTVNAVSGEITSILFKKYQNSAKTAPLDIDIARGNRGALGVSADSGTWQPDAIRSAGSADGSGKLVREVLTDGGRIVVTQEWKCGKSGYCTDFSLTLRNEGAAPVRVPNLTVNGGCLGTWQAVSGDKVRLPSHRLDYMTADKTHKDVKADKKDADFFEGGSPSVRWAAVSNKYFCLILDGGKNPFTLSRGRFYSGEGKDAVPFISVNAAIPTFDLAPGTEKAFSFKLYSGPKILRLIDEFDPSAGKVMHLAWGPLDYLARLMLWILVKLHALTGNYGISIILLTLLVRILFYPVTARGNASMKKMQSIQPKIKELREKYKDNPQLMNTKMMELYRTEGVNPFGGCLPILLQIPVFFALYATLEGAVELRQSSFLWCRDLAAADTVAHVFSLPINPLVLAMTALMMLQQRMTPMSGDPMQKKMMMIMPLIMLFFFYSLPSGLTLYWTVSNIFSIIQLRLQQRGGKNNVATDAAKN